MKLSRIISFLSLATTNFIIRPVFNLVNGLGEVSITLNGMLEELKSLNIMLVTKPIESSFSLAIR